MESSKPSQCLSGCLQACPCVSTGPGRGISSRHSGYSVTSRVLWLCWELQSPKIRWERCGLAQDNNEASCSTGSLSSSEHFSAMLCFIHLCMRFNEESLFPGECTHTLFEGRTNSWSWPTQAFCADISICFAEVLFCSPGYGLPSRSGHCFVHCSRNQFQPDRKSVV